MKISLNNQTFNTRLIASDWRYSASIVGLVKYFRYFNITYSGYDNEVDFIEYNQEDIREDLYLQFVEHYFEKAMHHRVIENILEKDEISEAQIRLVNEKLVANEIIKTILGIKSYATNQKEEILQLINNNRKKLIKETYKHGDKLYKKFANKNSLLKESQNICRLKGYYVDVSKKIKSISYGFDRHTFIGSDEIEFDFIPFAFTKNFDGLFINNNFSIRQLVETNQKMQQVIGEASSLFAQIRQSSDFIYFDVEVISKSQDLDYFESLYIRKQSIAIIRKIERYSLIQFRYKLKNQLYIDFENEVVNRILNNLVLDDLIELLLKEDTNYEPRLNQLIQINLNLYGGESMNQEMKVAYACAKQVTQNIPENKVKSYKQKLISAMVAHDYNRVCEILLQLSSYSGVVFNFAYNLFEDFEQHKNIAYTFINALNSKKNEVGDGNGEK